MSWLHDARKPSLSQVRPNGMKFLIVQMLALLPIFCTAQVERDPLEFSRKQRAQQVEAFKSFTGLALNGSYDWRLQHQIGETLKTYGVIWAQQSKSVPLMWFTFETKEDRLLPKGHVIATLRIELRTEIEQDKLGQLHMIKHPWGVSCWAFIAENKEAAHKMVTEEVAKLLKDLGELWRESHPKK